MKNILTGSVALAFCGCFSFCMASDRDNEGVKQKIYFSSSPQKPLSAVASPDVSPFSTPLLSPRNNDCMGNSLNLGASLIRQGSPYETFLQQTITSQTQINNVRNQYLVIQRSHEALLEKQKQLQVLKDNFNSKKTELTSRQDYFTQTELDETGDAIKERQNALQEGSAIKVVGNYVLPPKDTQLLYLNVNPAQYDAEIKILQKKLESLASDLKPVEELKNQLKEKEKEYVGLVKARVTIPSSSIRQFESFKEGSFFTEQNFRDLITYEIGAKRFNSKGWDRLYKKVIEKFILPMNQELPKENPEAILQNMIQNTNTSLQCLNTLQIRDKSAVIALLNLLLTNKSDILCEKWISLENNLYKNILATTPTTTPTSSCRDNADLKLSVVRSTINPSKPSKSFEFVDFREFFSSDKSKEPSAQFEVSFKSLLQEQRGFKEEMIPLLMKDFSYQNWLKFFTQSISISPFPSDKIRSMEAPATSAVNAIINEGYTGTKEWQEKIYSSLATALQRIYFTELNLNFLNNLITRITEEQNTLYHPENGEDEGIIIDSQLSSEDIYGDES